MKIIVFSIVAAVTAIVLSTGCGVTNPDLSLEFPFYLLQDISTPAIPVSCCYLKSGDDGVAGADSLYFVDYQDGYCLAVVGVQGYTIEDVGATAEGGYALALCGNLLFYVSDGTYIVHNPVALNSYGRFILTQPQGGSWHLYSIGADGSVTTVNSQSWDVVSVDQVSGLDDPVAAVITANGQHIFIADGSDNTVKKVSIADLTSVVAECHVPGGVSDMYAGPGNLIYAAPDSLSEIWGIDTGTGQHYSTYQIQSPAVSVAVTPDDHYLYAGYQGDGISVISTETGDEEVFSTSYGTITDIAVNGSGSRAMLCSNLDKILSLEK